jgi:hypothetical protein
MKANEQSRKTNNIYKFSQLIHIPLYGKVLFKLFGVDAKAIR